ncbi:MAG: OmpH family outer membrane protein [Deltaproteobacteria bacterium]|nr:OmpH family outer membrane protein [Deltaproteobacteria bacterium]
MEKFSKKIAMLLGCLFLVAVAFSPALAETKIGFFNSLDIIGNSTMGKRVIAELKDFQEKKSEGIKKEEEEIKRLYADLNKQKGMIRNDAFQERELEIQRRYRDWQTKASDIAHELQLKQQEKINEIGKAMTGIIQEIGHAEKYTLILDAYSTQLPYFEKKNDITEKIIAGMDRRYK